MQVLPRYSQVTPAKNKSMNFSCSPTFSVVLKQYRTNETIKRHQNYEKHFCGAAKNVFRQVGVPDPSVGTSTLRLAMHSWTEMVHADSETRRRFFRNKSVMGRLWDDQFEHLGYLPKLYAVQDARFIIHSWHG